MLVNGLMTSAHALILALIAYVSEPDMWSKDSAHGPTFAVIALVPDVDKWSNG